MSRPIRICILGAGPTGSLLALALAKAGSNVTLVDQLSKDQICSKSRAYAFTHSSIVFLKELGIWNTLEQQVNSFTHLNISDSLLNNQILFDSNDLSNEVHSGRDLGWIVDHRVLMKTVINLLDANNNIQFFANSKVDLPLYEYDYVIAADGHTSSTRSRLGIKCVGFKYRQACLTSKLLIRGGNNKIAFEIFRSEGPMALLPMGSDIYQLVWSAPYDLCKYRENFSESEFLDKIAALLPLGLEPDQLIDKPQTFRVQVSIAKNLTKGRYILLGEAAHSLHPVGGQGLNLCLRDVKALARFIENMNISKNTCKIGLSYKVSRYADLFAIAIFTDLLIRIFSNKSIALKPFRILIMNSINYSTQLKRIILKAMTFGPLTILHSDPR